MNIDSEKDVHLIKKPLSQYRKTVTLMQRALDTMTGIRKIRENIPVEEAVTSVFRERREFVSVPLFKMSEC